MRIDAFRHERTVRLTWPAAPTAKSLLWCARRYEIYSGRLTESRATKANCYEILGPICIQNSQSAILGSLLESLTMIYQQPVKLDRAFVDRACEESEATMD